MSRPALIWTQEMYIAEKVMQILAGRGLKFGLDRRWMMLRIANCIKKELEKKK